MKTFLLIVSIILSHLAFSQEDKAVRLAIDSFFEAMIKKDTTALKSWLAPQVHLATVYKNKKDSTVLIYEPITDFLRAVGTKDTNTFEEKTYNFSIKIDQNLAQAWCDYEFYFNKSLSHCGVNAFNLVKINNSWKITYIIDTRRKTNCNSK